MSGELTHELSADGRCNAAKRGMSENLKSNDVGTYRTVDGSAVFLKRTCLFRTNEYRV